MDSFSLASSQPASANAWMNAGLPAYLSDFLTTVSASGILIEIAKGDRVEVGIGDEVVIIHHEVWLGGSHKILSSDVNLFTMEK